MIGQTKIQNFITSSTIDSFPRTLMLVGAHGSGKHLLCDMIAEKLHLQQLDITDSLNNETIEQINERVEPYLYLIRGNEISVKEENVILKFLEEPLKNSYIVFLCTKTLTILPTILNRCMIMHLENYTKDQLASFITSNNSEMLLEVAQTPGQIKDLQTENFDEMILLADKMIFKIDQASIPNTLSITSKLGFKNERGAFPPDLFLEVLRARVLNTIKTTNSDFRLYRFYSLLSELIAKYDIPHVDKRVLFDKFLLDARTVMLTKA